MKLLATYDNTLQPNEMIQEVIGQKGFGDVVVKRKLLKKYYRESLEIILGGNVEWKEFNYFYDFEVFLQDCLKHRCNEDCKILHCFSNFIISDKREVALSFEKIDFIEEDIEFMAGDFCAAIVFSKLDSYIAFLKKVLELHSSYAAMLEGNYMRLAITGVSHIGEISSFIQCVAGNFDSRYFNSLSGNEYLLRKSSANKEKIKSEYQYYHLLPEKMKVWFVMPFEYQEDATSASYAMERLHMTDLAIKWVHGSIGKAEFGQILDMYFYFFQERSQKEIAKEEYQVIRDALYVTKVRMRIAALKSLPEFEKISYFLAANKELGTIDDIYTWYLKLKEKVERRVSYPNISVIGHGDPCFANTMYHRSTRTLKFIDPKGALDEEDLWTNPYYDIAKLSHSVCGNYDFFNNAMFDITIDEQFQYILSIPFDNTEYKAAFREKAEKNGYDYWTVRLYEASLFLSMLPLHIDYPHKVFGFLLNAINILKEIEKNV